MPPLVLRRRGVAGGVEGRSKKSVRNGKEKEGKGKEWDILYKFNNPTLTRLGNSNDTGERPQTN